MTEAGVRFSGIDSAPFGAVMEIDAGVGFSRAERNTLRERLMRDHVIVMRGAELSLEEQRRLIGYFGSILVERAKGLLSNALPDGLLGASELNWHRDGAFTEHPTQTISLYAVDVEDGRTSTQFADATRAFRTLPVSLRRVIEDLNVRLVYRTDSDLPDMPSVTMPIVFKHPKSAEQTISVDQLHGKCVEGLSSEESTEVLAELFAHLYDPSNVYEHWWRKNDLVIWDNIAVHHARTQCDPATVGVRTLRRVAQGTHTLEEQVPSDYAEVRSSYYPDGYSRLNS